MSYNDFWALLDRLVETSQVEIDRPQGSAHPVYPDMIYPFDYGYLAGTVAADGGGIDVWVGENSQKRVVGIICTVDLVKRDMEIKVLLGCIEAEMQTILDFMTVQRQYHCLLVRREP